ncbi:MAG: hypothetical protein AAGF26_19975 [Cyanobacteria bacterium P01_G01_bin.49]
MLALVERIYIEQSTKFIKHQLPQPETQQLAEQLSRIPEVRKAYLVCQKEIIIGGHCTIESREQIENVARQMNSAPVQALRGGAFKLRTSPYSFQGIGLEGLQILAEIGQKYKMPVVTEGAVVL